MQAAYSEKEIKSIIDIVPKENLIRIGASAEQLKEAIRFSEKLQMPVKDALHAILARDNGAVLISRDKHFYELAGEVTIKRPEDLI